LLASEKRSLYRFLLIYLSSTIILFTISSYLFYNYTKNNIIEQQKENLRLNGENIISKLRALQQSNSQKLPYPLTKNIDSAIYDLDKKYIFGTKQISLNKKPNNSFIKEVLRVKPYYLGASYLVVQKTLNLKAINILKKRVIIFLIFATLIFSILGYFLGRLFIAPMKESIDKINRFIQDATHELNTPISTILTNIELIENYDDCKNLKDDLNRIQIASKTLSRIYEDLAYLNLNHKYYKNIEALNISQILRDRINYFKSHIEAKKLKLKVNIEDNITIDMDKNDAIRLIDNIISNAIKYNSLNQVLKITLNSKNFIVEDGGVGISQKDLANIKNRFHRANKSEGGFGIGLDIVNEIIKSYNFELIINSKENIGTKVEVKWQK